MENKIELKRLEGKKIRRFKIYIANQISWREGKGEYGSGNI